MNNTLIIIPTYNEKENLELLITAIKEKVEVDILVVDDNSPDGTGKIADELSQKDEAIHVLHRTKKEGLGRAYIAGFHWGLDSANIYAVGLGGTILRYSDTPVVPVTNNRYHILYLAIFSIILFLPILLVLTSRN